MVAYLHTQKKKNKFFNDIVFVDRPITETTTTNGDFQPKCTCQFEMIIVSSVEPMDTDTCGSEELRRFESTEQTG
jgi:hypothetical protein